MISCKRSSQILLLGCLCLTILPITSRCQINGVLRDSKTHNAITNADIFINNTTIGTFSNEAGDFRMDGISSGLVEIIIYKSGYSIYRSFMRIQKSREYMLNITLTKIDTRKTRSLTPDEISWLKNDILKSDIDTLPSLVKSSDGETFTLDSPLIITNKSAGYKLRVFIAGSPKQHIRYAPVKYEQLSYPSIRESIEIEKFRQLMFDGSLRHWLITVAKNQLDEKGYLLKDSTGATLTLSTLLSRPLMPGYFRLYSKSRIIIHYDKNGSDNVTTISMNEPLDFNVDGVLINTKALKISGKMAEPGVGSHLPNDYREVSGNVEDMFQVALRNLFEKTYIHSDKDYYYPGERIWFKVYTNYYFQPLRDSLSGTLYVELIDHKKRIISEKILPLDSGFTSNEFIIPDTCKSGMYFLRAYTNLQRNFGPAALKMKPLSILQLNQRPVYLNVDENEQTLGLSVHTNKLVYKRREKVELNLTLVDDKHTPLEGNFSVSVTDASQVLKIQDAESITKDYPIEEKDISKITDLTFMVEHGFSLNGQFQGNKGKGEATTLNIVQLSPYNFSFVDTDQNGFFQSKGLQFYGERSFSITPVNAKGKTVGGKIKLLPRNKPEIMIPDSVRQIPTTDQNSLQRIFYDYESLPDSKLLEAVEIKANRENDLYINNVTAVNHPYGVGEFVFGESKIKAQFPNLLYSIQAMNIAGLIISPTEPSIYFARHMKPKLYKTDDPDDGLADSELAKKYTPLVTLDGTPMNGSAAEALVSIDPNTVASIEISRQISAIRGLYGAFGVIAVFSKTGYKANMQAQAGIQSLVIRGYAESKSFSSPDYTVSSAPTQELDNRTTLYWNPTIKNSATTGKTQVSFFTSDLTGTYRIVIEGVNSYGKPVRSVTFIKIEE